MAIALLAGSGWASVEAERPRLVTFRVLDAHNRALDAVSLKIAGPEPQGRVRAGNLQLPVPGGTEPGSTLQLELRDPRFAFLSPWDGTFQVPQDDDGQPILIVLGKAGDRALLESGTALRSFAEQVVTRLRATEAAGGELAEETRIRHLAAVGEQYDVPPEEIDRALRAWRDWKEEPLDSDDQRRLAQYLDYFPRGVEVHGGSTVFNGPVSMGNAVVIVNPAEPVTIHRAPERFILRSNLEELALGEAATLEIATTRPGGLAGVECSWEIEPADFLSLSGDASADCSLGVSMPSAPLPRYGPTVRLRVTAKMRRAGELVDEQTIRAEVRNAFALRVRILGAPLTPDISAPPQDQVQVTITRVGEDSPLPKDFHCNWSKVRGPIRVTPTVENHCAARIEVQHIREWSDEDISLWLAKQRGEFFVTWIVKTSYLGTPSPGGGFEVQIPVHDPRTPEELRALFNKSRKTDKPFLRSRQADGSLTEILARAGLPPLEELSEANLSLTAELVPGGWKLWTVYRSDSAPAEAVVIDTQRTPLNVLYSEDGELFAPWSMHDGARDLLVLASLDQYWVKLTTRKPPLLTAGPFLLDLDGAGRLRAGLGLAWAGMTKSGREKIACNGLVSGADMPDLTKTRQFLPIIESVAVRRPDGPLWRSQDHGANIASFGIRSFPRLPRPLGGTPYEVRVEALDRPPEFFDCPAGRWLGEPRHGLHHVLRRLGDEAGGGPPAIEVYIDQDFRGHWMVYYEHTLDPVYVRLSTDNETFETVRPDYRHRYSVVIREPWGKALFLRFGAEDGREIAYGGPVDFEEHQRTVLLRHLGTSLRPSCETLDPHEVGDRESEGKKIRCRLLSRDGWGNRTSGPIFLASVFPILSSIQFGCSSDRLDRREDFSAAKAGRTELFNVPLTFWLEELCGTIYARLQLNDGSRSPLLVIPVETKR